MTEELKKLKTELEIATTEEIIEQLEYCGRDPYYSDIYEIVVAEIEKRLKTIENKWHDLKKNPLDIPKGDIHRKILLQDRYGDIYTGNYYPKDNCHSEDCFAVEYLEYGFQGCHFVAFEQIAKWKEFEE